MTNENTEHGWWLYLIETDKGQLYTGISTDVERRFAEHLAVYENTQDGISRKSLKGAKFFRSQKPLTIRYRESFADRSSASKAEAAMKKLSAQQKRAFCT